MANNSLIAAFGRMWQQIKSLMDDNNEAIDSKISDVNSALNTDIMNLSNHENDYTVHVTSEERSKWNTIENTINNTEIDYLFNGSIFYVGSNSYFFIEGMTWEAWISSSFNTGYRIRKNIIQDPQGDLVFDSANQAYVEPNDFIIADGSYTVVY